MFTNRVNMGPVKHWNPWYGCKKVSPACQNCFIRNFDTVEKGYDTPLQHVFGGVTIVCLHSDFFLEEADMFREQAWQAIKERPEQIFLIITKRVERIMSCLPADWGAGYENVVLSVTAENQAMADYRIPIFLTVPAKHKWLSCCPLLEPLDLNQYLATGQIEWVETCGEMGNRTMIRPTKYDWVASLSEQCKLHNVRFTFMKIGNKFIIDNQEFSERTSCYHSIYADACDLDFARPIAFLLNNQMFVLS